MIGQNDSKPFLTCSISTTVQYEGRRQLGRLEEFQSHLFMQLCVMTDNVASFVKGLEIKARRQKFEAFVPSGPCPFNSDRVLTDIQKPATNRRDRLLKLLIRLYRPLTCSATPVKVKRELASLCAKNGRIISLMRNLCIRNRLHDSANADEK